MRPRGWASFWTILAAIAGVVGAAQPSIRCSTHIHNSFRRDFCRADDAISMPLDDPERSSSPQRSSRCNGQQSLSCRHPVTFVSRREATYRFVPSKRWPLSSNSRMLALSPSVEPAFTGHCGGDGERCDARPDRKGAVTLQSPPLPSLASVAPYRTKKGRDIGHLNRSARLKVAKQIGLYVSHQTISLPQALYGRNLHHAQHWMRPRYARLAFRSRSSRLLCALGLIDGWLSKSPRSSR